jgi:hypothetical protein
MRLTVLTQKLAPAHPRYLLGRIAVGQRPWLLYLKEQLARLPDQFSKVRAFRNSLASIAPMLKRVLVASRGA